jgi:hypothetical protein
MLACMTLACVALGKHIARLCGAPPPIINSTLLAAYDCIGCTVALGLGPGRLAELVASTSGLARWQEQTEAALNEVSILYATNGVTPHMDISIA